MDRLTGKAIVGWTPKFTDTIYGNPEKAMQCYNRLVAYENTGLMPEEIISLQEALGDKENVNWAIEAIECRKEAATANQERIRLEKENAQLRAKLDAAMRDMQIMYDALENESCETCIHNFAGEPGETICLECNNPESMWEWRGQK